VTETRFAFKKPSKYRSEDDEMIKVSNGETVWVCDKSSGKVRAGDLSEVNQPVLDYAGMVQSKMERSNKEYLGEDKIEGRDCFIARLTPIDADEDEDVKSEQKIWVDREFWYPLRIEMIEGMSHMALYYEDLEFNTGLSDDMFELQVTED
ncbi:MAG: LolA family protein, partial [Archaeoglobaceae archaeon]